MSLYFDALETVDRETREADQRKALCRMAEQGYRKSPCFKKTLDERHLDPATLALSGEFEKLPVISRESLINLQRTLPPYGGLADPEAVIDRIFVSPGPVYEPHLSESDPLWARAYHAARVPAAGPLLIAANHESYLDPPLVGSFLHTRQISYIARAGLFKFKPLAWLITALNSISLKEDSGDAAAIREILRRLERGDAVLIFPEGSRSPDGEMQEFKRGVALLVKKARCPVLPVAVDGCFDAWPRHRKLPRIFHRVGVLYGEPIPYDELMKDGPDAALERLHAEVATLLEELRRRAGRAPAAPAP